MSLYLQGSSGNGRKGIFKLEDGRRKTSSKQTSILAANQELNDQVHTTNAHAEVVIPAIKKNIPRNQRNTPYAKPRSINNSDLKENPVPISTPAMVYNSQPQQQERTKNTKVKKKENVNAITNQQGNSKDLTEYREPVDMEMNPGNLDTVPL